MVRFSWDVSCVSNGQPVFLKDIVSTNLPYSSISVASVINVTICLVVLQLTSYFVLVYDENGSLEWVLSFGSIVHEGIWAIAGTVNIIFY
jgi:hypothetical protein